MSQPGDGGHVGIRPERGPPSIQRSLDANATDLQWIVDSYAIVFAGLLLTAGAIGDRFGRKLALMGGLAVFAAGSLLGAVSDTATMIIVSRAVSGIGAAFVMPATLSLISTIFPPAERARAIAIWAGLAGAGGAGAARRRPAAHRAGPDPQFWWGRRSSSTSSPPPRSSSWWPSTPPAAATRRRSRSTRSAPCCR
ncbi:MAG: MFS transporter [Acidimicrobiales bacterium]